MPAIHVIVLAAGEGTRMKSRLPKVLHPLLGRPMTAHVVAAARGLDPRSVVVVASPVTRPGLERCFPELAFATQDPPRGTGDAAVCGLRALTGVRDDDDVVVVNGDCPGIRTGTLERLLAGSPTADGTFLAVQLADPTGYGRMVRDDSGALERIVEEGDCTPDQRRIGEVNAGLYRFRAAALREALAALRPDNAQGELYLTDTLGIIRSQGGSVALYVHDDPDEVHGVNTRAELARAEERLRRLKLEELMAGGVTVRNPDTVRVDMDVEVGADTVLYPGVVLESGTRIGSGCTLYPGVRVARSRIDDDVTVLDGSVVEEAEVERGASLGPYARLRPGASVGPDAKVGNFVEIKKSRLGAGSKASHLTYLGDAEIGKEVNIGAGTITCNYDGANKHRTVIEDGAFIGSNTALVAPVRIGAGAYVGAGSTITKDVPAGSLGVARGRQRVKEGWAARNAPRKETD